jgi:microcystin degradation protein MlrC
MTDETVLFGGFAHETNTFAAGRTERSHFEARSAYVGDEVPAERRGTDTCAGGAIDVADDEGIDLQYTVSASATPGGVVTDAAYDHFAGLILDGIDDHGDALDGVCLCLHGAMVTEALDDGEGELVARVRDRIGSDVPIAVAHDLHGNVSDRLLDLADALVAYEEYPHTDMGATGQRTMRLLSRTMREAVTPTMAVERPPVLPMGPRQNTREGPMADVMARARDLEDRDGVLKVNVFPGFHQADVPFVGFSIPVVTDDDPALAREVARDLAATVWDRREEFVADYPEPHAAVADAAERAASLGGPRGRYRETDDGPVVLADLGDNPGGGGAADGTTVLRELLDQGVTNAGFALIYDPAVVETCVAAGPGERVTVTLGGKTDDRHGDPIENLDGYVAALTDGEFRNTGPMGTGSRSSLGRAVLFQCGDDDGVSVIVAEQRLQPLDAEIWRHLGVQPERLDVLVVKSTNHFRADYEPLASAVVPVNSPGVVSVDPRHFDYERMPRPQFPLDEVADDDYPESIGSNGRSSNGRS